MHITLNFTQVETISYYVPMPDDFELFAPDEGMGNISEGLSENAKQHFAAAAQAMQQLRKEEKRAKKKDDQVAKTIIQFLNDDSYSHLFILISKLVARNCPSIFILGILSLINEDCLNAVREYLKEHEDATAHDTVESIIQGKEIEAKANRQLIDWITRLQMILTHDAERILESLLLDDKHIDGSVLQLTTFVIQEFFRKEDKELPFEKAQPLTSSILQTVFEPFLHHVEKKALPPDSKDDDL